MVSLVKGLALGAAVVAVGCFSPGSSTELPTTTSPELSHSQLSQSPSLEPGRYCYEVDSETLDGAVRLQVKEDQSVTGDSSLSIHDEASGYYSSYA